MEMETETETETETEAFRYLATRPLQYPRL